MKIVRSTITRSRSWRIECGTGLATSSWNCFSLWEERVGRTALWIFFWEFKPLFFLGLGLFRKTFYKFHSSTQRVRTRILHFQLRNLLWATSPHDLYTIDLYKVYHYSTLTKKITPVIEINPSSCSNNKFPEVTDGHKLEVSWLPPLGCKFKDIRSMCSSSLSQWKGVAPWQCCLRSCQML